MKYIGSTLIVLGILMLIALYITHFSFINELTLSAFLIIILGVIVHVRYLKRQSDY